MSLTKERVLVLNKGWTPIATRSLKRAISLVYTGHARIVDHSTYDIFTWEKWLAERIPAGDETTYIRTQGFDLMKFSVITLSRYSKTPKFAITFSRDALYNRDNHQCQYCGIKIGSCGSIGTIDHVIPISRGGGTSFENCVLSCLKCNSRKDAKTPEEAKMKLLNEPKRPTTYQTILSGYWREEWLKFIKDNKSK